MSHRMQRAFTSAVLTVLLVSALALPAQAGGGVNLGTLRAHVVAILDSLGVTSGGVYSGVSGSLGSTDRAIPVTDGTDGDALQGSLVTIDASGHVLAAADLTQDLGASGTRWRNAYVRTVHLGSGAANIDDDSSNAMRLVGAGGLLLRTAGASYMLPSGGSVAWAAATTMDTSADTKDTGLKRASAGVVQVTDGGSGSGSLMVAGVYLWAQDTTGFYLKNDGGVLKVREGDDSNSESISARRFVGAGENAILDGNSGLISLGSGARVGWASTSAGSNVTNNTHDAGLERAEAKGIKPTDGSTGNGYFCLGEVTAPTGTANTAKLYAVDNGAGKTQLVVIFGSGAAQVIATEP